MVTNLNIVCMVCGYDMCVIPRSVSKKDFGYTGYEFLTIANFVALLYLHY